MSEEITRTTAAEAAEGASAEVRNDIAEKAGVIVKRKR